MVTECGLGQLLEALGRLFAVVAAPAVHDVPFEDVGDDGLEIILVLALAAAACAEESAERPVSATGTTEATGDGGGGDQAAAGLALYTSTCQACHGEGGVGVEGLGKPLATSEFVQGHTDEELVAFIAIGRGAADPENTTGIAMPPRGPRAATSVVVEPTWRRSMPTLVRVFTVGSSR